MRGLCSSSGVRGLSIAVVVAAEDPEGAVAGGDVPSGEGRGRSIIIGVSQGGEIFKAECGTEAELGVHWFINL